MEKPVKGDVVVVPFPFSDLSQAKRRPALVLSVLREGDLILCQITSKQTRDEYAVALAAAHFSDGGLNQESYARPNKLFTADASLALYKAGALTKAKGAEIIERVCQIIRS